MQPQAVGYYLPAVMCYLMENCDDEETWIYLSSYLAPSEDNRIRWNLQTLGHRAYQAISTWAQWLAERMLELDVDAEAIRKAEVIAAHYTMAEPGAAPNGGPATPAGNSGVAEGPPSVSCIVRRLCVF